ncbi:MAG: O-antigen ligase family protein [Bacteroidota bacterium]
MQKKKKERIGCVLLFMLLTFSIFFLGSKMTIVLFFILNVMILLNYYKALIIPFFILIGTIFFLIKDRFLTTLEKSIGDRLIFFKKSMSIISENIWFGIGEKNIAQHKVLIGEELTQLIPHNVFLKEILSNGIFGLLIVLSLFAILVYKAIIIKNNSVYSFLFLILALCMIEDYIYIQRGLFFFIYFGILLSNSFNFKLR